MLGPVSYYLGQPGQVSGDLFGGGGQGSAPPPFPEVRQVGGIGPVSVLGPGSAEILIDQRVTGGEAGQGFVR